MLEVLMERASSKMLGEEEGREVNKVSERAGVLP